VNLGTIRRLMNLNYIPKTNLNIPTKCEICIRAKFTKKPFRHIERNFELLELTHSDLCNLNRIPTRGGNRYFLTFIDYYSNNAIYIFQILKMKC